MYNCISKALNRTFSNISVNFSSSNSTVTVVTTPQRNSNAQITDERQQPSPGATRSTSSTLVTSTPKNSQKTIRHHSTPHFEDCFEMEDIKRSLSSEIDELKCVAEISGDICESFAEVDVFSNSEEQNDENENASEKFVFDDYYWEDDICQYLKPEIDICSNVIVPNGALFKCKTHV
uniref:Uncharacterized protein n=1 Tax=Panagrolaimus superbus TaxID=310955 RepID=A0A914YZE8_9BILA